MYPKELKAGTCEQILYKYPTPVHSTISHNSQKVETTQMSTDTWMDKQNVVYPFNGLLFSLEKELHFWHMLHKMNLKNTK